MRSPWAKNRQRIVRRKLKRERIARWPGATRMHAWDESLSGREWRRGTPRWRVDRVFYSSEEEP